MYDIKKYPLWTAIVTPFLENGKIDFSDFEKLLRRQEKANIGIVILGSTGEGLALDDEEKQEILNFTCSLKLHTPIMVGVGGFNLSATLEWLKICENFPIHSYLMLTPLYAKPGKEGQLQWFRKLLDSVTKPSMLYNVPSRTGAKLNIAAMRVLEGHKNFWAIKEASGSIQDFQEYCEALPSIMLYSGDDALLPYFASAGAQGLVSVASNVWPEATQRYVELSLRGDHKRLFPVWKHASDSLFTASNPVPAKAILHELGIIRQALVRPPLSERDLASREGLIQANKNIAAWLKQEESY